jgi:hypothetical protein
MRINIGWSTRDDRPVDLHVVKAGQPHPYLTPPPSGAAGQLMGLATGSLNVDMFYTAPLDWEAEALGGTWVACGLHLTHDLLVPMFVFQGQGGQWLIPAPLIATPAEVHDWIAADTNTVNFYLMEAGTGIVRHIRHIGMDPDFMRWMKAALGHVPHPGDPALYNQHLGNLGLRGLWEDAKKWLWDPRRRAFHPV